MIKGEYIFEEKDKIFDLKIDSSGVRIALVVLENNDCFLGNFFKGEEGIEEFNVIIEMPYELLRLIAYHNDILVAIYKFSTTINTQLLILIVGSDVLQLNNAFDWITKWHHTYTKEYVLFNIETKHMGDGSDVDRILSEIVIKRLNSVELNDCINDFRESFFRYGNQLNLKKDDEINIFIVLTNDVEYYQSYKFFMEFEEFNSKFRRFLGEVEWDFLIEVWTMRLNSAVKTHYISHIDHYDDNENGYHEDFLEWDSKWVFRY